MLRWTVVYLFCGIIVVSACTSVDKKEGDTDQTVLIENYDGTANEDGQTEPTSPQKIEPVANEESDLLPQVDDESATAAEESAGQPTTAEITPEESAGQPTTAEITPEESAGQPTTVEITPENPVASSPEQGEASKFDILPDETDLSGPTTAPSAKNGESDQPGLTGVATSFIPENGTFVPYVVEANENIQQVMTKIFRSESAKQQIYNAALQKLEKVYLGEVVYFQLNEASKPFTLYYLNRKPFEYKVKSGDTLSKIAFEVYGNSQAWKLLWRASTISNPDQIFAGQKIRFFPTELAARKNSGPGYASARPKKGNPIKRQRSPIKTTLYDAIPSSVEDLILSTSQAEAVEEQMFSVEKDEQLIHAILADGIDEKSANPGNPSHPNPAEKLVVDRPKRETRKYGRVKRPLDLPGTAMQAKKDRYIKNLKTSEPSKPRQ